MTDEQKSEALNALAADLLVMANAEAASPDKVVILNLISIVKLLTKKEWLA